MGLPATNTILPCIDIVRERERERNTEVYNKLVEFRIKVERGKETEAKSQLSENAVDM